ncbi:hypothetical protein B0T21DRAFT_366970 [Apiosordaria backusii]|uniref:Uncharacterized protein n=1 Tax=Apiosordaria backusii TaxID=314023 RepID=A0AA40BLI6_9PEZI|nr:hypothetical protein B0T21DRAFT_366970 [Apiosordaria backusii]
MPLKRSAQKPAAAEVEFSSSAPPTNTADAQSPSPDTSPALTTAANRTSSLSDGYPDSPTLGATQGSGTAGTETGNENKQAKGKKGLWGVPEEVQESVGMATPAGQGEFSHF